ncbi:hypothetical protein QYM36_005751 [Artemia franciscana]|uniref:Myb/SANT-like DNA-binding domain-containing protein n=1 Tax=Artemia franciscana TaxID=6661 RepID=A0AA88HYN4_ARTSF|nr:hypothetical protein QYM36_005751 [Artemia franciscana]
MSQLSKTKQVRQEMCRYHLDILALSKKTKKHREEDKKAVQLLLSLVKTNWEALNDAKTAKKEIWSEIGKDMETKGFNLGDTPETKVSQKWRNLWALYKGYVKKLESVTGAGLETLEDTPPYIDEIRDIVGQSLAVHPSFVADSCGLDPSEYSSKNFSERLANRGGASIEGQGGSSSFLETEIGRDVSAADG